MELCQLVRIRPKRTNRCILRLYEKTKTKTKKNRDNVLVWGYSYLKKSVFAKGWKTHKVLNRLCGGVPFFNRRHTKAVLSYRKRGLESNLGRSLIVENRFEERRRKPLRTKNKRSFSSFCPNLSSSFTINLPFFIHSMRVTLRKEGQPLAVWFMKYLT